MRFRRRKVMMQDDELSCYAVFVLEAATVMFKWFRVVASLVNG